MYMHASMCTKKKKKCHEAGRQVSPEMHKRDMSRSVSINSGMSTRCAGFLWNTCQRVPPAPPTEAHQYSHLRPRGSARLDVYYASSSRNKCYFIKSLKRIAKTK